MRASFALKLRKLIDGEICLRMDSKRLGLANKGVPFYGSAGNKYLAEVYSGQLKEMPEEVAVGFANIALWLDFFHETIAVDNVDDLSERWLTERIDGFLSDVVLLLKLSDKSFTDCEKWRSLLTKFQDVSSEITHELNAERGDEA